MMEDVNATGGAAPTGAPAPEQAAAPAQPQGQASVPGAAPASGTSTPAPAATPGGGAQTDWLGTMPEALRTALDGVTSPEEAAQVIARGKGYVPATKPEDITVQWAEGVQVDEGMYNQYRQFCVEQGLTPGQAQALVAFEHGLGVKMQEARMQQGEATLRQQFGADTDMVKQKALGAFTTLDRKMDGRLSAGMGGQEIANNPLLVEALYHMAGSVAEDSLGGGRGGGGQPATMSDEQAWTDLYSKAAGK